MKAYLVIGLVCLVTTLAYVYLMQNVHILESESYTYTISEGGSNTSVNDTIGEVGSADSLKATVFRAIGNLDGIRDLHDGMIFLIWFVPLFLCWHYAGQLPRPEGRGLPEC